MLAEIKDKLLRLRWWVFHVDRRQMRRWMYKATRPASYPYVSGDGFRRLAKHIYDETNQRMTPQGVKEGDIVFVSTDYACRFFQEVDPHIHCRYRLITHNSDVAVDQSLVAQAGDRLQVWFAQNDTVEHEKVVPIPIGLENLHHYHVGIPRDYDEMRNHVGPRKNRILAGFTIGTNPGERRHVHELAARTPSIDQLPERLNQPEYMKELVTYKFLLSPPGNGLDTHRTWEAMYLGVVPIVKDSSAMRSFRRLGLPLWIVQEWNGLLSAQERDLERKYEELKAGFDAPALYMDYWREIVRGWREPARGAPRDY